jgi:SAM-dependent methyltransferase
MSENYTRYNRGVDSTTAERLLSLNRRFYTEHSRAFSATRAHVQKGVTRLLKALRGDESILDLGCGNGELARTLSRRGHRGSYLGLDFSPPFLKEAEREAFAFPVKFLQTDLTMDDWEEREKEEREESSLFPPASFDIIFAFAVLHHIPGVQLRVNLIGKIHNLLKRNGSFIHSNWQFLNSPRLRARIQSWDAIGLTAQDVDANDYLLDWKRGGMGLRYVHHFDDAELAKLAGTGGFEVVETFYSDGESQRLGLYQIWKKQEVVTAPRSALRVSRS